MSNPITTLFRKPIDWKKLLLIFGITLAAAGLSALLGGSDGYGELQAPPLAPPGWVFPVVWTILYLLMALAAYRVATSRDADSGKALRVYWVQLAVNALWTFFFFRLDWRLFAFFWLLLLLALVARTINRFRSIDTLSAWLLIPYFLWVLFAGYLNLGFYVLNR